MASLGAAPSDRPSLKIFQCFKFYIASFINKRGASTAH